MSAASVVRIPTRCDAVTAGPGCRTRVMALVGASHSRQMKDQLEKIRALSEMPSPPEIISDLSIVRPVGEQPLWRRVLEETSAAAACLPVYTTPLDGQRRIVPAALLEVAIEQMEAGVGLLTIHPTPCTNAL
jgi:phosphomethylpyrimidine synthase